MNSRLLEPELLTGDAVAQARLFALDDAGLLACSPPDANTLSKAAANAQCRLGSGPALLEWRRAIAAELFLLSQWDLTLSKILADKAQVLDVIPLPGGPPLNKLFGTNAAFAIAPLSVTAGARWLQVWAVQTNGNNGGWNPEHCLLKDAPGFLSGDWQLAAIPPIVGRSPKWPDGPSWKLAAKMAQRAVGMPGDTHECSQRLALDWVMTGDVAADNIEWVAIQEKRIAAREDRRHRRWLAPTACSQDDDFILLREALPGRLSAAADLREAWGYFTGGGFIETGEPEPWPKETPTFHAFVSDALGPIVAPLLLQQTKRVVFWVSVEKKALYQDILQFFRIARDAGLISSDCLQPEKMDLKAGSLEEAEACLVKSPELVTATQPVLFNITGGNMPPRLALTELARANPYLRMIYRPENRDNTNHYLELQFPNRLPRTRRLQPRDSRADGLINLFIGLLAKESGWKLEETFIRWCEEDLPKIAGKFGVPAGMSDDQRLSQS